VSKKTKPTTTNAASQPPHFIPFVTCIITVFFVFFWYDANTINKGNLRRNGRWLIRPDFKICFRNKFSGTFAELPYLEIDPTETEIGRYQDYGSLDIKNVGEKRIISDFDYLSESDFRPPNKDRDDDGNDAYYAFDDDYLKGTEGTMNVNPNKTVCRRTSTHRLNFRNCNTIFETDLLDNGVRYLNAGSYRQVFSLHRSFLQQEESVVVKDMHADNEFKSGDYEFVRMDAMVAERLTSSPRIYDIYGFCGLSILSEFFPYGDVEDQAVTGSGYLLSDKEHEAEESNELKSYNEFSSEDKLVMSLQMAEALADLHGDIYGIIVHQDVQLSQYLTSSDKKRVKLNDFNRAEFMLWDDKGNEYCKYAEGHGNGNWRSPEEYFDHDLTEEVDVFSLGNNMYSILTGLYVFYDEEDDEKVKERVKAGEKAYIDPRYKERSLAETKLAEIIDRCHSYNPEDRPSIFSVVKFLRDALTDVRNTRGGEKSD